MLPQKTRDFYCLAKDLSLICISWLVVTVSLSGGYTCAQAAASRSPQDGNQVQSESTTSAPSTPVTVARDLKPIIERICLRIYEGDFSSAREILRSNKEFKNTVITQLGDIISEYEAIEQKRKSAREAEYNEQLDKLAKFQTQPDTNDVNDVNNTNRIPLVVVMAFESANEQQKSKLLSDPFTQQTIQEAKVKAGELEAEGKWLDAYLTCYNWLQIIEPNNKSYSDHAEQLIDKANIAASFQDSSCETRHERFSNVKKKMFIRAIDALNDNYVTVIDYRQMAIDAIRRCKLLAEVISVSSVVRDALYNIQVDTNQQQTTSSSKNKDIESRTDEPTVIDTQYIQKLSAWSTALAAVMDEVNQILTGITKDKFVAVFEKVLTLNTATAELPQEVLIAQFAEAALSALDDYTVMVWPRQVQDFEKMMTNEFTGIGIEITKREGLLTVASLLPDTPAYNSGLDAGDVIEAVDGNPTKDMTLLCAVRNITGPKNTKVKLTVSSLGQNKTRDITIIRDKIIVLPIRGWQRTQTGKWRYMIDEPNKIGYVRITSFDTRTAKDLEKVLSQLEEEGLRGLILDLRFNSGGLLNSAIEVTDKFLEEGLIVRTQPRWPQMGTYANAKTKKTHPKYPLVALINSHSASASEIVAGALADKSHNRALLVGERTHGKGSVQGITSYPREGAQLKYTMAYYHLPSGQRVESRSAMEKRGRKDWGVGPDIEVALSTEERNGMLEIRKDNDILVKAGHDIKAVPLKRHTSDDTIAADPQLAIGLLIIRTKLIQAQFMNSRS